MGTPRVLLLFPGFNTFSDTFSFGFKQNNWQVLLYDFSKEIGKIHRKVHAHIGKAPFKLRNYWYSYFVNSINEKHLEVFRKFQPDLVIAYNSMQLLPDTIVKMKRSAKVCFFLGDSPFYTKQNDYYLPSLMQVDHVFCPDSFWQKQLKGIGFNNVHFFLIGSNPEVNYPKEVSKAEKAKWGSDLLFVGANYSTVNGYKRALFLNQFAYLDIKIYTSSNFQRWYRYFPDLERRVVHPEKRLTDDEINTIVNCCKIYPVDANPGILNGVHLRIFDCIASGILPLAEYRKDVMTVFGPVGLPIIENYKSGGDLAAYYLNHEEERLDVIRSLQEFTEQRYAPQIAIAGLLDRLKT